MPQMKSSKRIYYYIIIGLAGCFMQAQEKEALKIQEVLVVKSYTPSLSDVFKIKDGIQIPDSLKTKGKVLKFNIKPIAVVSTFEPNKASPLKLKRRSYS